MEALKAWSVRRMQLSLAKRFCIRLDAFVFLDKYFAVLIFGSSALTGSNMQYMFALIKKKNGEKKTENQRYIKVNYSNF
ncbi:MAG: hypothetical protein JWO32_2338 [Bacteroidetes bacterium]|nr:hypothetical protein [Bacteroidota bacterium]